LNKNSTDNAQPLQEQRHSLADIAKIASDSQFISRPPQAHAFAVPSVDEISQLLPQFKDFSFCGRGGMGIVYQCTQTELKRSIAVKILPSSLGSDTIFKLRFEKEAQLLASLSHPSIITIFDYGVSNKITWFSMEYISGGTLADLIQQDTNISVKKVSSLLKQICSAIQTSHEKSILHRDLKPHNILLTADEFAIVSDFGIAYSLDQSNTELTFTGLHIASNPYSAPELSQSEKGIKEASKKSDIYSIGAIAYRLLTGEAPTGAFPYPSECGDYSTEVDQVIRECLSPNPEKRPAEAMEFYTQLTIALGVEPNHKNSHHPKKKQYESVKSMWGLFGFGIIFTLFLAVFLSSGGNNFSLVHASNTKLYQNGVGLVVGATLMHIGWLATLTFLWKKLKHLESCPNKLLVCSITSCIILTNILLIYLAVKD